MSALADMEADISKMGKLASVFDVREAMDDFVVTVGDCKSTQHATETTGDGSFRFNKFVNGFTYNLVLSPGTIGIKTRNLFTAEKAVARREDAHAKYGVDVSPWWSSFDLDWHYGKDAADNGRRYEVLTRDDSGDPLEIVDTVTGQVHTEISTVNKHAITAWSKDSRAKMVEVLAQLDYSSFVKWLVMPPLGKLDGEQLEGPRNAHTNGSVGMVTLTLPGDWVTVAPNGKAFKRLFSNFKKRWMRDVGEWRCLWKLEFQERGAPHIHILTYVPALVSGIAFEAWVSETWCDTVAHPDPEERRKHLAAGTGVDFKSGKMTDPRRIGIYFMGHSAKTTDNKEYQHLVPKEWQGEGDGPGRFWGYNGLVKAVVTVEMTRQNVVWMMRELRKLKKARDWRQELIRERGIAKREKREALAPHLVKSKKKRCYGLGRGGSNRGGFVLLNDALPVVRVYGSWIKEMNTRYTS
jgi:hypothetical protein